MKPPDESPDTEESTAVTLYDSAEDEQWKTEQNPWSGLTKRWGRQNNRRAHQHHNRQGLKRGHDPWVFFDAARVWCGKREAWLVASAEKMAKLCLLLLASLALGSVVHLSVSGDPETAPTLSEL